MMQCDRLIQVGIHIYIHTDNHTSKVKLIFTAGKTKPYYM